VPDYDEKIMKNAISVYNKRGYPPPALRPGRVKRLLPSCKMLEGEYLPHVPQAPQVINMI
jgi:hypothetical protein